MKFSRGGIMHGQEPFGELVRELRDFAGTAVYSAHLRPADLRRVLSFTSKVSQVADQAFQDVLAVLIEVRFLKIDDLRTGRVIDVQKQVELLTLRSRYRDAEEICSRLHHLSDQFRDHIVPLLTGVDEGNQWQSLFGLINEHEGRLIELVRHTVSDLALLLERIDETSLNDVVEYAKQRIVAVRAGIDELRELSNRILGLSGEDGILELTEIGGVPHRTSVFLNQGSVHVSRDTYSAGQAGAMGPGSAAQNMTFSQVWNQHSESIDLAKLELELSSLRAAMRAQASEPEHDLALGEVAAAEKEAKNGNGPRALEHLKKAGKWALDVATKIGVGVATSAIKAGLDVSG